MKTRAFTTCSYVRSAARNWSNDQGMRNSIIYIYIYICNHPAKKGRSFFWTDPLCQFIISRLIYRTSCTIYRVENVPDPLIVKHSKISSSHIFLRFFSCYADTFLSPLVGKKINPKPSIPLQIDSLTYIYTLYTILLFIKIYPNEKWP